MQTVKVKVEWVDSKGFHFLANNVVLTFNDDVGTFPMPKDKDTEEAFRTQHLKLFNMVPTATERGFTFRRGLCFTRVRD